MYRRILVPIDLAHTDRMSKALDTATGLARDHGAEIVLTGVAESQPTEVAHSPEEFAEKMEAFAKSQSEDAGVKMEALTLRSHDISIDLHDVLMKAIKQQKADLVVMASHLPGPGDYIFHGHAAHVATHAPVSVFVIREDS